MTKGHQYTWHSVKCYDAPRMAAPPLLVMWLGAPDIRVQFNQDTDSNGNRLLDCVLLNRAVTARWQKWLRISRQHVYVSAHVTIREEGTKRHIAYIVPTISIPNVGSGGIKVPLIPSSRVSAFFWIVSIAPDGTAQLPDATVLPLGRYIAEIELEMDSGPRKFASEFAIGSKQVESNWLRRLAEFKQAWGFREAGH